MFKKLIYNYKLKRFVAKYRALGEYRVIRHQGLFYIEHRSGDYWFDRSDEYKTLEEAKQKIFDIRYTKASSQRKWYSNNVKFVYGDTK